MPSEKHGDNPLSDMAIDGAHKLLFLSLFLSGHAKTRQYNGIAKSRTPGM
jgi:hypothetical protein